MTRRHLFVYGTLKRGCRKHALLEGQEFLGPARTLPRYRLYDGGAFPCLVPAPYNGIAVQGELWTVDEEAVQRIDVWEDAPHLFIRRTIDLEQCLLPVEAYFYRGDVSSLKDAGPVWPSIRVEA